MPGVSPPPRPDPFLRAIAFTLRWEGGLVNHPNDPGGKTAYGITQKTYNAYRDSRRLPPADVFQMRPEERDAIYRERYWDMLPDIQPDNLKMAVFDAGVNSGVGAALKWLRELGWPEDVSPKAYNDRREKFYRTLAANNPKLSVFLKGWLNRLNDLRKETEA